MIQLITDNIRTVPVSHYYFLMYFGVFVLQGAQICQSGSGELGFQIDMSS